MNALDTNVLTRFLTADDAAQNRRATKLLADAEIAALKAGDGFAAVLWRR